MHDSDSLTAWARRILAGCVCAVALAAMAAPASAQFDDDDDMDDVGFDDDDDDDVGPTSPPPSTPPPVTPPTTGAAAPPTASDDDVLVCDGGWRYPLTETREEIGPARFARQLELQRDLQFASKAFAFCAGAAAQKFEKKLAPAKGPCAGMMFLADRVDVAAANLFRLDDEQSCQCLTKPVQSGGECEGLRAQLTTLRRYDEILVQRAELVLSTEVCTSPERSTNYQLRKACESLEKIIEKHWVKGKGFPGQFSLSAPLPASIAAGVTRVRKATDGRYLSVLPENFIGVRQSLCKLPVNPVKQNQCTARVLEPPKDAPKGAKADPLGPDAFAHKMSEVTWGMCNELALSDVNASTCRDADVYIDERGQLHLNRPLTTRSQRRKATMCVDVSDFDENHPLMVTLGMDPTDSVPKRLWPGETMLIGDLINRPVTREDILKINVYGKARGVSLTEVLRVNNVKSDDTDNACRVARSWVPVVDHEVPIGDPRTQKVIPVKFGRGRDGETPAINEGDYVLLWVRDIEPNKGVLVEYADGQLVGYEPAPLLGGAPNRAKPGEPPPPTGARTINPFEEGSQLRGGQLGVGAPLLPRRARYPGSRVLRLGSPAGSTSYGLKVCEPSQATAEFDERRRRERRACSGRDANILMDEQIFVHGDSHFGVKFHFGYSFFPLEQLEAQRTPAAIDSGSDVREIVQTSDSEADYDVAVLLAVYPFGRNPRRFSYNPLSADYWKSAALLAGFSVRTITPWEDFYAGAALPVANGVSLSLLAHFSQRSILTGVDEGQLVTSSMISDIPSKEVIAVGVSAGLTFDFDLFERAFFNIWDRLTGKRGKFLSATGGSPGWDPND